MVNVYIDCGKNEDDISDCRRILVWMQRTDRGIPILNVHRTFPSRNPENMKTPERVEIGTPDFVVKVSGETNLTVRQIKERFQSEFRTITRTPTIEVY